MMQITYRRTEGLVLVAVLVTISLLTLLLAGEVADVILMMRSHSAYWQSSVASRQCEQLAVNTQVSTMGSQSMAIANQENPMWLGRERLLNAKPCAMVLLGERDKAYMTSFLTTTYQLVTPQTGVCEVTIARVDNTSVCLTPSMVVRPGLQSWRWLPK